MNTYKKGNPKDLYPKPPFPKQTQEPPGITSAMQPRPDHGEKSYIGCDTLLGKVAIITGGDSGIGKAVAIAMAREGADVVISYKDDTEDEDAFDTRDWVERSGRTALLIKGNIRNEAQCKRIVDQAVAKFGKIDILVNNAAYQMSYDGVEDISEEEWNKTFQVNMSAMFYLVKYAKKHMAPGSSIINTTSVNAYNPKPSLLPYAATKGAIQYFTSSLTQMFQEVGLVIRCITMSPLPVWTPVLPSTI